ncbi:MAG: hypothetical protein WC860_01585 [Candidatus Margulisiibacteriota bacterium]|jgi:hypothetical protein
MEDLKECVHGLFWQTCNICKGKESEEIQKEVQDFGDGSTKSKIKYDYNEVQDDLSNSLLEIDNAYDLDEGSDF